MAPDRSIRLQALVQDALAIGDVRSAALFVPSETTGALELEAAAGIEGPALDGLVAAVRQPVHPVAKAMRDAGPTFDALPVNPGGPRLRSHLPVRRPGAAALGPALGVLALAHDSAMDPAERERVAALAVLAAVYLEAASDTPA